MYLSTFYDFNCAYFSVYLWCWPGEQSTQAAAFPVVQNHLGVQRPNRADKHMQTEPEENVRKKRLICMLMTAYL